MSVLHRSAIKATFLILLAACARPAHSGLVVTPATTAEQPAAVEPVSAVDRLSSRLLEDYYHTSPRGAVPVLVIPAKELDGEVFGRIVKDLTIMSRIIEKSIRNAPELTNLAVVNELQQHLYGEDTFSRSERTGPRIVRSSQGRPKPMYVGGYGAVFSLEVAFPLLPPPEATEQDETASETDEVWAQAQRELLDPEGARRTRRRAPQGQPYSREAVESLRNTLVTALKHATNIRNLGPESWLVILVQGPSATVQEQRRRAPYGQQVDLVGGPAGGKTLLTLRARKADIDQYAKGQVDETQFQQRVQIVTH
jgi:hypothetical protein